MSSHSRRRRAAAAALIFELAPRMGYRAAAALAAENIGPPSDRRYAIARRGVAARRAAVGAALVALTGCPGAPTDPPGPAPTTTTTVVGPVPTTIPAPSPGCPA